MSINNVRAVGDDRPWKDEVERELYKVWDAIKYGKVTIRSGTTGGGGGGGAGPDAISAELPATYNATSYIIGVDQGAFDYIENLDYAKFDTTSTAAGGVGILKWNDTDGTLEFGLKGGNVTLQVGQEQVVRVRNDTGSTLSPGTVCYIDGSNGTNFNVAKAIATGDSTSAQTLGVLTEELNTSSTQHGFLTTFGLVRGIDLSYISGLAEGDQLYLDGTTAGRMTKVKPSAPVHLVYIGICLSANGGGSNSTIFVKVQNGYELDEIHDVKITGTPADNEVLAYTLSTDLWENKTAAEAGLISTSDVGTVTNTMLAGSIENAKLTNSSVTVAGQTVSLGGSTGVSLDNLSDVIVATPAPDEVLKYNGTNWVNAASPGGGGGTVTSITAGTGLSASPSSPITTSGTLSLNASLDNLTDVTISTPATGQAVVYNGSGWVNSSISSSPNFLINGGFDFWQRGTSFTATGYTADRWYFTETGTCTITQVTNSLPDGFNYAVQAAATTVSDSADLYQALENIVVKPLRGQTVTFSCYIKMDANMIAQSGNFHLVAKYSTTTDARASQTTSIGVSTLTKSAYTDWARATYTFTVPSNAVGLMVGIEPPLTVSPTSATYFVTGAMLELGSSATTFRRAGSTWTEEQAACFRYYQRHTTITGRTDNTNVWKLMGNPLGTILRAQPTSVIVGTIATPAAGGNIGTNITMTIGDRDMYYTSTGSSSNGAWLNFNDTKVECEL